MPASESDPCLPETAALIRPSSNSETEEDDEVPRTRSYGTQPSINTDPRDTKGSPVISGTIDKWPFFCMNVLLAVMTCSDRSRTLLLGQYVYSRIARDILGNITIDTASHPCVNDSGSTNVTIGTKEVQDLTSTMLLHLDLISFSLSIPANVLLGIYSTALSRKAQLLIPTTGFLLRCASILVVVAWDFDIKWLYAGCGGEGLVGGIAGIYLGVYLYTTDITPRDQKRTLGLALIEGFRGIIGAIVNVASGMMIQKAGFLVSSSFTTGCAVIGICLMCILPTRKPFLQYQNVGSPCSKGFFRESVKSILLPFRSNKDTRVRKMVLLASVAFFLSFTTTFGVERVRLLYLMNEPFCWDAITIGWYQFGRQTAYNIFTIGSIPILYRCLPGVCIGILGAFTNMGEYLAYAFATDNTLLYVGLGLSVGQALPISLIRGETSRLFGPDAQGPLFAIMAAFESLSFTVATYMIAVYRSSLSFFPGLVYLVSASVKVLVILHLVIFQIIWRRYVRLLEAQQVINSHSSSQIE